MKRISLLYTYAGGGHLSLAKATAEALNSFYRQKYEIALFDPFPPFYSQVYKRLSNQFQNVWKLAYSASDHNTITQVISYLNGLPIGRNLAHHLHSFKPDLVISNNGLVNAALSSTLNSSSIHPLCVVQYADPFTLHQLWLAYRDADLYLSPTSEATSQAIDASIPSHKIKTVGWITRQDFLKGPLPSQTIRPILGLDKSKFTIFIGGAGQGEGKTFSLVSQLVRSDRIRSSCQLIVNTGLNTELVNQIMKLVERFPNLIHFFPYSHNMPALLSASDLIIGKAGPNFLFETVHELKPLLATSCIPGQEKGNLEFIKNSGIGWVEENTSSAVALIETISAHPELIKQKIPAIKKIKSTHMHAARKTAYEINYLLTKHP